jgi:nickel-dependent lactate racemase
MRLDLIYGEGKLAVNVPDRTRVLEMSPVPPLQDPAQAVQEALREPIESPALAELARGRRDACVVISDITRPVPNRTILPVLLGELEASGIPPEGITILIATGMHRPNEGRELESMVGKEIMDRYRIVNHDCEERDELRHVADIEGAPIEINRHYLDADLKILTGLIEPHFYAGYSGGRKSILPGISSYETMKFMHSYAVIDHPGVRNCKLEGNIFHEYGLRVTEQVGADFILNVVINTDREVSGVFAGHYNAAHLRGCEFVAEHAVVEIERAADLVITSGGGYPLDSNFYQISKGLTCAKDILRPGGTVIVACECREGLGSDDFCSIMRSVNAPEEFFAYYSQPENFVKDQWCAQNIYQTLDHAGSVFVCSKGLSAEDVERMGAVKTDDVQGLIDRLAPEMETIVASPAGPYVVGMVK